MSHDAYNSPQPPPPPPPPGGFPQYSGDPNANIYTPQSMAGERAAQLSLIFGIVGLFFFGLLFGALAIWQAAKAERLNKAATAGKVLGWISLLWGIAQIVLVIMAFAGLLAIGAASTL